MALVEMQSADWLDDVVTELAAEVDDALDFVTTEFEASRARAQRYYNGESDLPVDANRSRYVATKVRDAVRSVRPSLMRIFVSCEYPVCYVPQTVAQAMIAERQTMWAAQFFNDLGGYKILYDAFHDAMLFKLGVVKYWYEGKTQPVYRSYTGLSEQQVQMLTSHPLVEVIAGKETQVPGPQGIISTFDVDVVGKKPAGEIKMAWVPLDEFLISREASCKKDARVIAHRRNVPRGELLAMGYSPEDIEDLDGDDPEMNNFAAWSFAKRGYSVYGREHTKDESMQPVLYTEAYYRADLDGIGIPQLYKFCLGGTDYKLLAYERADDAPFALFAIDPEPGTIFGKSLYDITQGDQDVQTSLTRATVDNFHMTNNPRLAVHEHMVNMDDVLNNDLGSPIRVRAAGQIQVIDTPFTGAQGLPLLQFLNAEGETKTGITRAAAGLDPDAMQSTDKDAVRNTIQLAQGQIELMARNLAETGMVDLFGGLLVLAMTHLDTNQILRTPEGAQPMPIDVFQPNMATRVHVGTGTGSFEERVTMLNEIFGIQREMLQQYGPGNPVVSLGHIQNTITDKMRLMGMYNPFRYFGQVTPQLEKQLADNMQQQAQKKEQTQLQVAQMQTGALAQAEKVKADAKVYTDTQKTQLELRKMSQQGVIDSAQIKQKQDAEFRRDVMQDDLARDQMLQDLYIAVMELKADMAQAAMVRREQESN